MQKLYQKILQIFKPKKIIKIDQEEVQATITMEFGEGNLNTGPICRKCYSIHRGPRIAEF